MPIQIPMIIHFVFFLGGVGAGAAGGFPVMLGS